MSQNICCPTPHNVDWTTLLFSNPTQIGVFGNSPIYIQSFTGTMPSTIGAWGVFGNIGIGRIPLGAFGSFTNGTECHFFPGGTNNTEMSAIYYNSSNGNVYAKTQYSFPLSKPARVNIIYR